ncbi:CLUMA_CG016112, isoform A [Clunio marinus]|uniref:CLUMA_CG016112, isoform A n=1 Tax=Clunio marinus TaxID=568069 RepID=A0A1J1IVT4_9DIPT|nr:CLUMA_CG016112, isoform A [Clunio marinus]
MLPFPQRTINLPVESTIYKRKMEESYKNLTELEKYLVRKRRYYQSLVFITQFTLQTYLKSVMS